MRENKTAARYTEVLERMYLLKRMVRASRLQFIDMREADAAIENASGQLIAIEVKTTATVSAGDFRGLICGSITGKAGGLNRWGLSNC